MYRSILSVALVFSGVGVAAPAGRTVTNLLTSATAEVTGDGSLLKVVRPQGKGGVGRLTLGVVLKAGMGSCDRFDGAKIIPAPVGVGDDGVPQPNGVPTVELYATNARGPLWEGVCTAVMKYQEVVVPLTVTYTTMDEPAQGRFQLGGGLDENQYSVSYDFQDGSVKVKPVPVVKP